MIYEIPTDGTGPAWQQETSLDGRTYRMTFRWNEREEAWYLTLTDLDDTVVAGSLKLVSGARLLRHFVDYTARPPGELLVAGAPTLDTLQNGGFLYYLDADEVA